MKVRFERPHSGGSHNGIGTDYKVIEQADDAPIPTGGVSVDPSTPTCDWTYEAFEGKGMGVGSVPSGGN
jgi:hypothetical protein